MTHALTEMADSILSPITQIGVLVSFSSIFKVSIYTDARPDIVDLVLKVGSPYEASHSHRVSLVLNRHRMLGEGQNRGQCRAKDNSCLDYIYDRSSSRLWTSSRYLNHIYADYAQSAPILLIGSFEKSMSVLYTRKWNIKYERENAIAR